MGSGSTQHATHALNYLMRLQWLALYCAWVLARCLACGANGHERLTARAVTLLLLAEALETEIAVAVRHRPDTSPLAPTPAVVHLPQFTALAMGHLVQMHVSGFSQKDPPTHSQPRQKMLRWHQRVDTLELRGETVPAMH